MDTIHLIENERWYKTRKPQLQIEILACLSIKGKLSKSMVESILKGHYYRADILNAFKSLEENKRIQISHSKIGRGRPQNFYKITEKGFELLIVDDPKPEKFWKALIGFCYNNNERLSVSKVEILYQFFIDKYLKYSSVHSYSFQLNNFNEVCNNWLNNMILNSGKISSAQKIIEVLAVNPAITFDKFVRETGDSAKEIMKALLAYTPIMHQPLLIGKDPIDNNNLVRRIRKKEDWDFLLHNAITIRHDAKGNSLYELSLYGVILALTLIRYNDMERLKHGLHYNNLSFQSYYDKIASNYKEKLPLIFEKWHLLKVTLKEFSAYNFDIILDKETRLKSMNEPVLNCGNKEFYENAIAITSHNHKQLGQLQTKGLEIFFNYRGIQPYYLSNDNEQQRADKKLDFRKVETIYHKLIEISIRLNPLDYDPESFNKELKDKDGFSQEVAERLSRLYKTRILEEMFAEEITSLYYMNLNNDYDFQVKGSMNYYSSVMGKAEKEYFAMLEKEPISNDKESETSKNKEIDPYSTMPGSMKLSPKRRMLSILKKDKDIREWFCKWIVDLVNYQKESLNKMNEFYKEIENLN
jgi:hypothetical protein